MASITRIWIYTFGVSKFFWIECSDGYIYQLIEGICAPRLLERAKPTHRLSILHSVAIRKVTIRIRNPMIIWQNKTAQYGNTAVKYQMKAKGAPRRAIFLFPPIPQSIGIIHSPWSVGASVSGRRTVSMSRSRCATIWEFNL